MGQLLGPSTLLACFHFPKIIFNIIEKQIVMLIMNSLMCPPLCQEV